MSSISPKLELGWLKELSEEFEKDYFRDLKGHLVKEKKEYRIYPPGDKIFAAFDNTPFENVKVVIIGQDPYHGPGQANGLSFSVAKGITPPPSLKNIFKELSSDLGMVIPDHGDLHKWAREGVLMLNAVLTVRHKQPGSHRQLGWETFTDSVIRKISGTRNAVVFILWGNFARSKKALIDTSKHHIIESPHPSPYSANSGFFGSRPFSKANEYLVSAGKTPVDWSL